MLRHVVLFRWAPGTTDAQVASVTEGLAALPAAVAEIRSYRFGPDLGLSDGSFDFALVADFADRAAWETYRDHPVHRAFIAEHITPVLADRAVAQYEVPG